ncbi:MAG: glycosyltransferase family 39 protein [Deltaproteobacteria bacterium]|nr:glycosyltransferase family 39 protein [Deltaproteobacteria bacterium]
MQSPVNMGSRLLHILHPANERFWIPLAAGIILVSRLPYVNVFCLNMDEGIMGVMANTILDGGLPYRDAWNHHPPLVYYLYAAVFAVAGRGNMVAIRLVTIGWVMATAWILQRIGRESSDSEVGNLAAFLYAIFSVAFLRMDALATDAEIVMLLFTSGAVYLFLTGHFSSDRRRRRIFLAGFCLGAAFLAKPQGAMDAAAIGAFLLLGGWRGGRSGRWKETLIFMSAGFVLPTLGVLAYFAFRGALDDLIFLTVTYNLKIYGPAIPLQKQAALALVNPLPLLPLNWLLWGLALFRIGHVLHRRTFWPRSDSLFFLWAFFAFIGASMGGRGFGHYYLQMLPPLCLLGAFSLKWIRQRLGVFTHLKKQGEPYIPPRHMPPHRVTWPQRAQNPRPGKAVRILLACILAAGMVAPVVNVLPASIRQLSASYVIGDPSPDLDPTYLELARYIRQNSREDHRIFVWGFQPIIYAASGRRPASKFIICHALTGQIPWVNIDPDTDTSPWILPGSWKLLMEELEATKPLFIVDTSPGNYAAYGKYPIQRYLRLYWFIKRHYVLDRVIFREGGRGKRPYYHVYRRLTS